jgi:hypothetical protein
MRSNPVPRAGSERAYTNWIQTPGRCALFQQWPDTGVKTFLPQRTNFSARLIKNIYPEMAILSSVVRVARTGNGGGAGGLLLLAAANESAGKVCSKKAHRGRIKFIITTRFL